MIHNPTISKPLGLLTPLQKVQEKFSGQIIETHAFRGDETVIIRPSALRGVARFLKDTPELDFNF